MIDLETERRPDVLRQVAQLQQRENQKLRERMAALVGELAALRGTDATLALQLELMQLQEQLDRANHELFGRSSERRKPGGDGAEASLGPETPAPQRGHGPRAQPELPVVEIVHTLDLPDQACPACGGALTEMAGQHETSEEIDVVVQSYRVLRHLRQKYRCRCGGCVDTALGPEKLQPRGRYSIDFAVSVAVAKYLDHAPLARQVRQMARAGLVVDTQTLFDQLLAVAAHLAPSYEALTRYVLESPVIGADETVWRMLDRDGGKRWYAWSALREDAVVYRIDPSRSAGAARALLGEYRGVVLCDGYRAYETLAAESRAGPGGGFVLAHCWAHVRRKFVEAELSYPLALEALDQIAKLYQVEAEVRALHGADADEKRLALRRERSRPIVEEIRGWLAAQRALPQSALGRALAYTDSLWPGLVRFLDDPAIPLDNNGVERALRGMVLGRKNHYGSKSRRGTEVAALYYSLLESAKLAGLEPASYLAEATRRAIREPGAVTLPRDLASR
jgi:transposase